MNTILFVGTGDTCRSPMAAGIFTVLAQKKGILFQAKSCGVFSVAGMHVFKYAIEAAAEYDVDLTEYRSTLLSKHLLDEATYVFGMTAAHCDRIKEKFSEYTEKIRTLALADVADPFGSEQDGYKLTANQIDSHINDLIETLCAEGTR